MKQTYFEVLGVSPQASTDELKHAWRAQVRLTHPDHGGSRVRFEQVQRAYETLRDPASRAEYVLSLTRTSTHSGGVSDGTRSNTAHTSRSDYTAQPAAQPSPFAGMRLGQSSLASVLFSVTLSLTGMLLALTTIAAGFVASAGHTPPQFSSFEWWVGSAVLASLCADAMVIARRGSNRWAVPAVAFVAVAGELVLPYAAFTVTFAWMVLGATAVAVALLALPFAKLVLSHRQNA